jgi:DNA-binding transcriptional MerR regulator/methylmalonyl-CoA mutase cobalamin-binding subunit
MSDRDPSSDSASLTIGEVSEATGIPASTLRTWERRYGFPDPSRNEIGHRRYDRQTLERLELMSHGLELMRPRELVRMSRSELERVIGTTLSRSNEAQSEPSEARPSSESEETREAPADTGDTEPTGDAIVEGWLEAAERYDAVALATHFQDAWYRHGVLTCVTEYMSEFVQVVGDRWERDELSVGQEHFASEQLRDFLTSQWRPLSARSQGPRVVCATLPGEQHVLGLHLAATIASLGGARIIFLGADTPMEHIVRTSEESDARAIMLSVSVASNRQRVSRQLRELRRYLAPDISLVVGGRGCPAEALDDIIEYFDRLAELQRWAGSLEHISVESL